MNYQSESEVQRMKELIGYGINEQTVNTGGSKPIVEYKMKAADGKTYGIIHECNKFYIKVAPKKDTEVLAKTIFTFCLAYKTLIITSSSSTSLFSSTTLPT